MNKLVSYYLDSFRGFGPEVWWLALVTFVNRAGTMVIPFLSLYLTDALSWSLEDVGWVMSAFGCGSVIGSWLGGKLSDRFGFYAVMFWSLLLVGLAFIALQFIQRFEFFCLAIFCATLIGDTFRPAMYVSLQVYSRPENRTRAVTLIRLAINLGFTAGPAIGGLIIATGGYGGLFWIDGITCILAAILFVTALSRKQAGQLEKASRQVENRSPYRDGPYLLFLFIVFLTAVSFLQYFSTIPLYYRDVHLLSEAEIGILLGCNGLLIFLLEMPLIKWAERPSFSRMRIMVGSTLLFALSFAILNLTHWDGILLIGMVLMTVGEMFNFPFANRFAMDRAERGKTGEYMALFTISFSLSHIVGHNAGLRMVESFGYSATWYAMSGGLLIAASLFFVLRWWLRKLDADVSF